MEKKIVNQYRILRCFATLFAIVGHACSWYQLSYPSTVSYSGVTAVLAPSVETYFYSFHMPLFFCLSGAVLRITGFDKTDLPSFVRKKAKRLLTPYFLVGLLYMFPVKTAFGYFTVPAVFESIAAYPYSTSESGYLWYLASLFGIFMLFILFSCLFEEGWEKVALPLFLFLYVLDFFLPLRAFWEVSAIHFFYFLLGYHFETIRSKVDSFVSRVPAGILVVFSLYFYFFFFRNVSVTPHAGFTDSLYLSRIFERFYDVFSATFSCLMWYLLSSLICVWFPHIAGSSFVVSLDRESLAMYLIHDPLNYPLIMTITAHLWTSGSSLLSSRSSLIIFLTRSACIYLISYGIALLLRKIPRSPMMNKILITLSILIYVTSLILAGVYRVIPT